MNSLPATEIHDSLSKNNKEKDTENFDDVQQKIESIPGLKCKVKITMQPQWGRDMINPEIRELMGL